MHTHTHKYLYSHTHKHMYTYCLTHTHTLKDRHTCMPAKSARLLTQSETTSLLASQHSDRPVQSPTPLFKRLVGPWLLISQQHARVSQGLIHSGKCMCCYAEIEIANQAFNLTQSQYTDTGLTRPSTDPATPGVWQGSHWSTCDVVTGMTPPGKRSMESNSSLEAHTSTTRPLRRSLFKSDSNRVQQKGCIQLLTFN